MNEAEMNQVEDDLRTPTLEEVRWAEKLRDERRAADAFAEPADPIDCSPKTFQQPRKLLKFQTQEVFEEIKQDINITKEVLASLLDPSPQPKPIQGNEHLDRVARAYEALRRAQVEFDASLLALKASVVL